MKDQRAASFLSALESLMDSLDATVRLKRWNSAEEIPGPLRSSADKLVERLGAANRLAAGKFVGAAVVAKRVSAMCDAIRRLDTAYVSYRKRIDTTPAQSEEAVLALDEELGEVKASADSWA
jgi:hypothetical protein